MGTCVGGMCCSRQVGLGLCHRAAWNSGKSGASPQFFGSPSPFGGGQQICGELQEVLSRKDKPHVASSEGEGKGQSAAGRVGGRQRVKGAGPWGWKLEEQLNFISNSQYVPPKHKGWHFVYCWEKLSPGLSTTPFLCIVENRGKITNQSSDSNKKTG